MVRLTGVRFPARPILLGFFLFGSYPKHTVKTCGGVSKNISRLYSLAVEHSLSKREVTGSSPVGGYENKNILLFLVACSSGDLGPEESFESSILCSTPDFKRLPDFWLELRAIQTKGSRKTQKRNCIAWSLSGLNR